MPVRIDLHAHSTASDGTDSPAELVAAARAAGVDVLGLTDHDTSTGWAQAAAVAVQTGVSLVRGAEITCAGRPGTLHLLGYLFDPDEDELRREMDLARGDRVPRAAEIVRRLAEAGYPVTMQAVLDQTADAATLGRPHIADALVAAGAFPDRDTAFAEVLYDGSPYYVGHYAVEPARAVRLVRASGGVPVLAHPRARAGVSDELIAQLASAGLAGLEVDHPEHSAADRAHLGGLARDLGLLATGSSDYHGRGKPARLGQERTDPEVFAALVEQARGPVPVLAPARPRA